ncbi:hypothetical protein [Streptomyces showdoensis]|uniref:hypothetical protein n=1 Tax=Streptomyces showdoensis TaxID=68268 RepID=UPI0031ED0D43
MPEPTPGAYELTPGAYEATPGAYELTPCAPTSADATDAPANTTAPADTTAPAAGARPGPRRGSIMSPYLPVRVYGRAEVPRGR